MRWIYVKAKTTPEPAPTPAPISRRPKIEYPPTPSSPLGKRYRQVYSRAVQHGIEMTLTIEEFNAISQLPCNYCGALPAHEFTGGYVGNGLDRVNSTQGYTFDNVVPCCWMCNSMKNNVPLETFLAHVELIHEHCKKS